MDSTLLEGLGLSNVGMIDRPLFVIGPPRSGTTIISRAIGAHRSILGLGRQESMFVEHAWRYRNVVDPFLFRRILLKLTLPSIKAVLLTKEETFRLRFQEEVEKTIRNQSFGELYKLFPIYSALNGQPGRDVNVVEYWKDKTTTWLGLRDIGRAFPEARYIFVFRDPRDTLLSQSATIMRNRGDGEIDSDERSLVFNALYWRRMARCYQTIRKSRPNCAYLIRYEDFVSDSIAELRKVFSFLALKAVSNEELSRSLAGLESRSNFDRSEKYQGVGSNAVGRWKSIMNERHLALICAVTGSAAGSLGYSINGPSNSGVFLHLFKHARNPIDFARFIRALCMPRSLRHL